MWTQQKIEQYIADHIQESLTLEYKEARALEKTEPKRDEITKDTSAMANSAGGIIIYGVREFKQSDKRHLPECIDPINCTIISREWLEQTINDIRPRITGVTIHPIQIDNGPSKAIYVVEIPQSTTAHQARSKRYYKRYNFQSVPMDDHEIRDVMNRRTIPDVDISFSLYGGLHANDKAKNMYDAYIHYYGVKIILHNRSNLVVNRYKAEITFVNSGWYDTEDDESPFQDRLIFLNEREDSDIKINQEGSGGRVDTTFIYQPSTVLFPNEEIDLGKVIGRGYPAAGLSAFSSGFEQTARKMNWYIEWKIYADNMPRKIGEIFVGDIEHRSP